MIALSPGAARALRACVHCGLCQQACPTYLETGIEADSPRGRIDLVKALASGRVGLEADLVGHLDLCLGCRACEPACPSGVAYGEVIESVRETLEAEAPRTDADRWRRSLLARTLPDRRHLARVAPLVRSLRPLRRLASVGWLPLALRRRLALIPEIEAKVELPEVLEPVGALRATVAMLPGCVVGAWFSRTVALEARLLARAGYRVVVARGAGCCGALSAHLGRRDDARRHARRAIRSLRGLRPDFVVPTAAGCGAHLRGGAGLADDAGDAWPSAQIAARVRDATELLAEADLPFGTRPLAARVAYHDACHLAHGQGVRAAPRRLLARIPGVEVVALAESDVCCGSAGTYNLTEPEMAWRLAERKARAVVDSGADVLAAANTGCLVQIRAALDLAGRSVVVAHPLELVARSCGVEP